jgi:glycosyltransferase involved in cell wall biosynthesis
MTNQVGDDAQFQAKVSTPKDSRACVYATEGWGIHDERWMSALRSLGYRPTSISLGRDVSDSESLRKAVESAALGGHPVLAGPLHTVTEQLASMPIALVGLSWGYDLEEMATAGADLTWLPKLGALIVDSDSNRDIAKSAGVDPARITFLPWGIDLEAFALEGPRISPLELGLLPNARIVLSLRAHEPQYRVGDIIEAFAIAQAKDTNLVLVIGHEGSLTAKLKEQVSDLDLSQSVRFIGPLPESELAPLLRGACCYVTASQVDGTSVTLLQAMACGTPVVASNTAGNQGWVTDKVTGHTFPTHDVAALAAAISSACAPNSTELIAPARALVESRADWKGNLTRLGEALDQSRTAYN